MGNSNTKEDQIEDIIEEITSTDKFQDYCDKFEKLNPARHIYIDDDELTIEVNEENKYSIIRQKLNWLYPQISEAMYEVLDKLYDTYIQNEQNLKNNDDVLKHDFITMSNNDMSEWSVWAEKYVHTDSNNDLLSGTFLSCSDDCKYSPQFIWRLMLREAINGRYRLLCTNGETIDIVSDTSDGLVVAMLNYIDDRWWYVNISKECMNKISRIHNSQNL